MENRIGEAVREKRKAIGYSQEELAEKLGKTSSFIGQIERGTSLPSLETLAQLTQLLAIDANVYFYNTADRNLESREFYLMLEQISRRCKQKFEKALFRFVRRQ